VVLLAAATPAHGKSWFFRPQRSSLGARGVVAHQRGPSLRDSPGSSYSRAWRTAQSIDWGKLSAGDTLFICGLHDSGRADGALNLTKTRGSGVDGAPVVIDGRCVDDSGHADPGTLMAGKMVSQHELGKPDAHGIFTYSYDSPSLLNQVVPAWPWRGQQHVLRAGLGTAMANKPDILERSVSHTSVSNDPSGKVRMVRLKRGDCGTDGQAAAGPVRPENWLPGTACYTGVWTNRTTIYYKPSNGVNDVTLYVFEYNRPSSHTAAVNGWPPLSLHYAEHVVVRNLTLQGPAWEIIRAIGGHHVRCAVA
jgi:hypothetical protein